MKNRDEVESKTFVLQKDSGKGVQQDKKDTGYDRSGACQPVWERERERVEGRDER
jgi:hypothetical protein